MNFYLNKYGFQPPFIQAKPHPELEMVIVIPCYDEDNLIASLNALYQCNKPNCAVEVIVIINAGTQTPESIKVKNRNTYEAALNWSANLNTPNLHFHIALEENLPKKHAGVGLARKIGMDEAVNRFDQLAKDGVIVCFDADALCLPNYLQEIEKHFLNHPKTPGCSIHYEHPIEGTEFEPAIYKGIINYELHLRYYNQGLKYAGLPYAYHTVGSSMAVRSSAYQKQGGMNKRKAGEDFYFIHKIIALGGFTELKTTAVIPSPRISDRVPFGTGKAIGDWVAEDKTVFETYAFESFEILKAFVDCIPRFRTDNINGTDYGLAPEQNYLIYGFLMQHNFQNALDEIRLNSKTEAAFIKRFFRWFDAFKVLKFMHFMRDNGVSNQSIFEEVTKLMLKLNFTQKPVSEVFALCFFRNLEKK
jgi:cellulose synthase/poly-beta-1,6-N-acetylglucosamine synthase-like glycosyltransferase